MSNRLTVFPESLVYITGIVEIYLSGNLISTLPSSIGHLRKLRHLDLSDNQIISLPTSIRHLTSLASLHLNGNPIRNLNVIVPSLGCLTSTLIDMDQCKGMSQPLVKSTREERTAEGQDTLWLLPFSKSKKEDDIPRRWLR
jgi:leucine-rich repeat protein SHOC2